MDKKLIILRNNNNSSRLIFRLYKNRITNFYSKVNKNDNQFLSKAKIEENYSKKIAVKKIIFYMLLTAFIFRRKNFETHLLNKVMRVITQTILNTK